MIKRLDVREVEVGDREAEESSRRGAELQLIFDAIPALIFYKSPDNRIVRANRAVTEALGDRKSVV